MTCVDIHTYKNIYIYTHNFFGSFPSIYPLQSLKVTSDLTQRSLVKVWSGCHLNGPCILKPKTGDMEVPQGVETIDKAAHLNILELLAPTPFLENDQDDNNKLTLSFICWHIIPQIFNITLLYCYMIKRVLLVVEFIVFKFLVGKFWGSGRIL